MARTEGSDSATGEPSAGAAPEGVRRPVSLPAVTGDPGDALGPTVRTPQVDASSGDAGGQSQPDSTSRSQPATDAPRAADASGAGGAAAAGNGDGNASANAAAAPDRPDPDSHGVAAAGGMPSTADDDDPTDSAGRPKKPFLAASAIAGAVLIAVPLLILGMNGSGDDPSDKKSVANADTLLGDDEEAPPVDYAPAPEESPTQKETPKTKETPKKESAANKPSPPKPSSSPQREQQSGQHKEQQKVVKPPPPPPVVVKDRLISADTGRCLTVNQVTDGAQAFVWDCDSAKQQRWRFESDGTVRIGDLCLDIGAASTGTEAKVQVAYCNGNVAQQFRINGKSELIAVISNYCIDVWQGRGNGTTVTTWHCNGQPNQKWRRT